ncbi:MAG: NifB/NifX family molybdenum-iron cluster-binding protein [Anaerolineae bacterium]|jgi:predicted Fe-Mo cluster-binding NifX family protein
MRIVISSQGEDLQAATSPVFGRCPTFLLVDTETGQFEAVANPAVSQGGGAGIQAAQFVVERGAQAVLSGNLGPNAFDVLLAAEVPCYLVSDGTVGQAVEAFKAGQLQSMAQANVPAHAGMGRGAGRRMGRRSGLQPPPQAPPGSELVQLRETLKDLRQQLAETMDKIDQLEKEA